MIVLVFSLVFLGMYSDKTEKTEEKAKKDNLLEVKSLSLEEAAKGMQAGDVTYRVGEGKVLFKERRIIQYACRRKVYWHLAGK